MYGMDGEQKWWLIVYVASMESSRLLDLCHIMMTVVVQPILGLKFWKSNESMDKHHTRKPEFDKPGWSVGVLTGVI